MNHKQDSTTEESVPLVGGRTHTALFKVGATVRRPTGRWTPGVHALLKHLELRGYYGAPRAFGIDRQGREVLSYVPGRVVWPDNFDLVRSNEALQSIAQSVRCYHDLTVDFNSTRYLWCDRSRDPSLKAEVMCHNDLSAWNLVMSDQGWVFIDWDLAAPGRRAWDIAWSLLSLVPLAPDANLENEAVGQRVRVFCESYGIDCISREVLKIAYERAAWEAERIQLLGGAGEEPYSRLLAEGHFEIWSAIEKHVSHHLEVWTTAAFGMP